MHICTTCDNKYLLQAMALYQSLCHTMGDKFTLHVLCLDNACYERLLNANLPRILTYSVAVMEQDFPELQKAKHISASRYGDQRSQYIWALTPWFINFLLKNIKTATAHPRRLLYADADIFFYQSPRIIFDVMPSRAAVGIHTHRFTPPYREDQDTGWYNVGVMAFNSSAPALNISETWKSWLMRTDHPFYERHGTCGDQKYLELFIPFFGKENICVFDDDPRICHLAPWCTEGDYSKVLFYHFSHFRYELPGQWWDSLHGEWHPSNSDIIKPYYERYFEHIKQSEKLLQS